MSSINSKDCDRPSERDLNNHVIPEVAGKWKEIGIELLDSDSTNVLDIIEHDHQNDTIACCTRMFKKWLDSQEHASWEQMLTALRSRSVQKNALANKIENMLIREASPPAASSIDFSECHDISEGFILLTTELSKVLRSANFSALKRAFNIAVPGVEQLELPDDLKEKIKKAKELDTLLDALVESKYWNFADLRLVGFLVMSSGMGEAKALVDKYKEVFFSPQLVDILNTHTVQDTTEHPSLSTAHSTSLESFKSPSENDHVDQPVTSKQDVQHESNKAADTKKPSILVLPNYETIDCEAETPRTQHPAAVRPLGNELVVPRLSNQAKNNVPSADFERVTVKLYGCCSKILDSIAPEFSNVNMVSLLPYLQEHLLVTTDEKHHLSIEVHSDVKKAQLLLGYLKRKEDILKKILCCLNLADEHSGHKDIAVKLKQIMEDNNIKCDDFCAKHSKY